MTDVTQILSQIESGDPSAAGQLLPLVYDELRKLAAVRLAREKPGQTLQATALVHEVYLRLVGKDGASKWESKAHFFGAAAEAMRRILVERARHHRRPKHGGDCSRVELKDDMQAVGPDSEILAIDESLNDLAAISPDSVEIVKLRYYAGFTLDEIAELLNISRSTVQRRWNFARVWLFRQIAP